MIKYIKYLNPFFVFGLAYFAFTLTGFFCWTIPIYAFILVPIVELVLPPNANNLSEAEEEIRKKDKVYDFILYSVVLTQVVTLFFFLKSMNQINLSSLDLVGRIFSMGIMCGTFGINVGHELGHRKNKFEQLLAKLSLMTSLYMHFFIEHNKGHHKHVATPQDPSSARFNEPIYLFFPRTIFYSYLSAWHIANQESKKRKQHVFSVYNEMIQVHLVQSILLFGIYYFGGGNVVLYFIIAAFIGILMLETVNYIEHYGLQRKPTQTGYERVQPYHSWNSNHGFGRIILFELSRHSDHHYMASRKYQILKHHDESPQLPTGYPGSMLLAFIPPLWFRIMNKKIEKLT